MTLTEIAGLTKKTIIFSVIFLILAISTWLGYKWYRAYEASKIPPPKVLPKVDFGKLPKINLPLSKSVSSKFTYTLNTPTGTLPTEIPEIVNVYFIPEQNTTFLAGDRAKELASKFDFNDGPETLSAIQYKFSDSKGENLIININNSNFSFRRATATDSAEPQEQILADKGKIIEDLKSYLSNKGLLKEQLKDGRSEVYYNGGSLKDSSSAEATIWQDDVNKLKVVNGDFDKGLISATFTKYKNDKLKYSRLDYTYWPIDLNNFSTYPIKSVEVAFDELKAGKGVVVKEDKNRLGDKSQVSITSINLAYFLAEEYNPYLQPIYVFEGEGFVAYLPAVTSDYLEQ